MGQEMDCKTACGGEVAQKKSAARYLRSVGELGILKNEGRKRIWPRNRPSDHRDRA